jgi:hypothetical protein
MKYLVSAGLGALACAFAATPASALTIVEGKCVSVLEADGGCVFDANNDNDLAGIEALYNATTKAGRDIELSDTFLTKSDSDDFGDFGSITGDGGLSGTWSLPGFLISYISVKASTDFKLIKLTTPSSSGSWSTVGLCAGRRCNQPGLSHVSFFGEADVPVIPEPASWAMLIVGFGLVGSVMRRRQGVASVHA